MSSSFKNFLRKVNYIHFNESELNCQKKKKENVQTCKKKKKKNLLQFFSSYADVVVDDVDGADAANSNSFTSFTIFIRFRILSKVFILNG